MVMWIVISFCPVAWVYSLSSKIPAFPENMSFFKFEYDMDKVNIFSALKD